MFKNEGRIQIESWARAIYIFMVKLFVRNVRVSSSVRSFPNVTSLWVPYVASLGSL